MATAKFISKDQNWQNESTTYWFKLDDGDVYGVCESGGTDAVLDADGCPLTEGDGLTIAVRRACVVTDELRSV